MGGYFGYFSTVTNRNEKSQLNTTSFFLVISLHDILSLLEDIFDADMTCEICES